MILFKRNKKKDGQFDSTFWNGKQRIGYDSLMCYTEKEINAAKKKGFYCTMAEVQANANDSKKRNIKASTESDGSGDGGDDSPEQRLQLRL